MIFWSVRTGRLAQPGGGHQHPGDPHCWQTFQEPSHQKARVESMWQF